jgi:hypothetical protein
MRQAVLLGMTAYHPGTDCMQPSYQRSAGEVRGRDLNRIVFFTFNNIQRGHKHCSADSACSCRLLSESRPVQTPHVVGSRTVAGFRDCLNPPARSLVWSTIIPPFNLCYVSRIIKLHGSCIPIWTSLGSSKLSTSLAVVLLATLSEAPMSPPVTTE